MSSVYFVHHYQDIDNYDWATELTEINYINPDIVVCFCSEEWDVKYIFRNLFTKLSDWAVASRKIVKVLSSVSASKQLFPKIFLEKTYGLYDLMQNFTNHVIETNQVVNPKHCHKVFTNYNNIGKYERAMLLEELARRHLLQHGMVTFLNPDSIQLSHTGVQFPGWKHHDGSRLIDEPSLPQCSLDLPRNYMSGLIDLVSETTVRPNEHYVTEKTVKPIVTLKPFICLSSPGYHKFLTEEYGLELYDELFDYSFDQENDLHKRISMIVGEVERIVQCYNDEFKLSIYEKLLPKLIRNRERYVDYGTHRENMMIPVIETIVKNNYTIHGSQEGICEFTAIMHWYKEKCWL
jgi:hypothetical protein